MSKKAPSAFRFIDFLVIVLCLSGAAYSINLFRNDLFGTFNSRDEQPVGIITARTNTVQRRLADRVLWDRLSVNSSVYLGDLIRTSSLSSAALRIEGSNIDLDENTIIRIYRLPDGEGSFGIDLSGGSLSLVSGEEGGNLILNLMGRQVEAGRGTVLNAAAGEDGIVLQVSEGTAAFIDEGGSRELSSGTMISQDAAGLERTDPAAVMLRPRPGARYLKNTDEKLVIGFSWNRLNLTPGEALHLEISTDRGFTQIEQLIEGLSSAEAAFDTGLWFWRLRRNVEAFPNDTALASGSISVLDAAGPRLLSPARDSFYRYEDELPVLRFQWAERGEASSYFLEVSQTEDFINPRLSRETDAAFLIDSSLGPGTWFWRVMPVFPPTWEGSASFSAASVFRIEQGSGEALAILPPEPVIIEEAPEPLPPEPGPLELSLLSPAAGASIPGLTALRQQTVFTWAGNGEVVRARFVLSRNSNPLAGTPAVSIANPDRTVRLNSLAPGDWYWTVEAEGPGGITSAAPRLLRVPAIPRLAAPGNRAPAGGRRIGIEELRAGRSLTFSWSAVAGANAYIFSLYQQTTRALVMQEQLVNRTSWTVADIGILEPGSYFWQVEAVNMGAGNSIDQRGNIIENSFVLDVPPPGPIRLEEPGIFYGN